MVYQKQSKWLLLVLLITLFIPYLYISNYANPVADDLIYAANRKGNDLFYLLVRDYLGWNGRYSSNILVFSNPMAFDSLVGYKLIPPLIIVLTVLSNFVFVHVLWGLGNKPEKIIAALLFSLLFLYQMPILSEGIYWYTGAVTYQLANCLMFVYVSLLIRFISNKVIVSKVIHSCLLTIFLAAIIGFNEIHMIAFFCFACISLFITRRNRLHHRNLFLYLLFVTLIFASFMVFAPGNKVRAGLAANNHQLISSIIFSGAQTLRFLLEWISSPPLLLLSVVYYQINKKLRERNPLFKASFYLSPGYAVALLFFVIFISVFPAYWAMGILGQHRTLNVGYCLFLIMWFINLTVWFNAYEQHWNRFQPLGRRSLLLIYAIVMVSLFFTKNGFALLNDLFYGKAYSYDYQMQQRTELMNATGDTLFFAPIVRPPQTLFLYDITEDPDNWLNQSYTLYFAPEKSVVVKK